ncbi:restriction endonuclease subunit S [Enterococcus hirae]|uniref:restriction endonuclease subunit S n=1 Tax=Enterococcus hirae TaxID=1354 RepID=UPI0021E8601D|nr:restriction endonuclease subunit S [Enterococcus hirae]MCV3097380.1 restriction endonuclease subunit S [Enterococcus hirae]MCV3124979.1 restriction endonuclease subunit S [Enterococcus hirae]
MSNDIQPEIRFPGFTEDWEERKLSEMANFSKGNGYSKADLAEEGHPVILYGRLYTKYETIIENVDTFAELKEKSVISNGGEVIVPASGETPEDISRASVVDVSGVALGGDLNIIKTKSELDPIFLALTISNGSQQKEMTKRAQGKSVVHLHNSDLKEVNLLYPKLDEQVKIGSFFKKLDVSIALHQRKLDLLKETKKGFLQKMFPKNGAKVPEIRFPGFTGDWEERKFEEIWKRTSDKNKDLRFKPTDILSVAKMKYSDSPKNSTDEYMKTYFILKKGDIAFEGNKSKDYSFGRFVLNDVADGIVSHVFITFEPIAPMDINFMKIYINNEEVMKHKLVRSTTKTLMMTTLNVKDINRQMLPIPNLEEQQKIGTFFKQLDDTITLHQRKLDLLKETKKGFLQKMFV